MFSLSFLPLSFRFILLDFLSLLGPGGVGGNTAGGGLSRVGFRSRFCDGSPLFSVLSFVTVGHWFIGRPRNGSVGGLLELPMYCFLGCPVLALPMVHSAQRQQGGGLRVLGRNCSLHEFKFRLCPEVVLDWFPRFADQEFARLADSWRRPAGLCRTFDHGWVVCPCLSVLEPIGLHAVTALVALTVS